LEHELFAVDLCFADCHQCDVRSDWLVLDCSDTSQHESSPNRDDNRCCTRFTVLRPLITAVFSNNDELVDLYLKRGEKINQQDDDQFTPLHHAVKGDGKQTVKLLLERGADPSIKNADGFTPLMMAQE
jgi:hypothetical protein